MLLLLTCLTCMRSPCIGTLCTCAPALPPFCEMLPPEPWLAARVMQLVHIMVQVYQGSLTCIRASAEPLLSTFVTPCVTLFQTHQHPACLDILATCIELFGPQPTATNMLTHALYVACSASEPIFSVSYTSNLKAKTIFCA